MPNRILLFILWLLLPMTSLAQINYDTIFVQDWYLHQGYGASDYMQVESTPFGSRRYLVFLDLSKSDNLEKELKSFTFIRKEKNKFSVEITYYASPQNGEYLAILKQNKKSTLLFLASPLKNYLESAKILTRLAQEFRYRKNSNVSYREILLPRAHAEAKCAQASSSSSGIGGLPAVNAVMGEKVLGMMMNCARNVADGIWDSTGGRLNSAAECFKSPIECAKSSIESLKNIYSLMTNLKDSILKLGQYLSNEDLSALACSMAGSLGTDLLIAAATSGVGGAKLALTMTSLTAKLSNLLKLLAKTGRLKVPIEWLAKYKAETIEKITALVEKGKLNSSQLEAKLIMCTR